MRQDPVRGLFEVPQSNALIRKKNRNASAADLNLGLISRFMRPPFSDRRPRRRSGARARCAAARHPHLFVGGRSALGCIRSAKIASKSTTRHINNLLVTILPILTTLQRVEFGETDHRPAKRVDCTCPSRAPAPRRLSPRPPRPRGPAPLQTPRARPRASDAAGSRADRRLPRDGQALSARG